MLIVSDLCVVVVLSVKIHLMGTTIFSVKKAIFVVGNQLFMNTFLKAFLRLSIAPYWN